MSFFIITVGFPDIPLESLRRELVHLNLFFQIKLMEGFLSFRTIPTRWWTIPRVMIKDHSNLILTLFRVLFRILYGAVKVTNYAEFSVILWMPMSIKNRVNFFAISILTLLDLLFLKDNVSTNSCLFLVDLDLSVGEVLMSLLHSRIVVLRFNDKMTSARSLASRLNIIGDHLVVPIDVFHLHFRELATKIVNEAFHQYIDPPLTLRSFRISVPLPAPILVTTQFACGSPPTLSICWPSVRSKLCCPSPSTSTVL